MSAVGQPELSVIIPTYARNASVIRAVVSALDQDVDLEVIIVDDGSPTPVEFMNDDRVRVLRLATNVGTAAARNAGVRAAHSNWIAFLDSDDAWTAGTLRSRLQTAQDAGDENDVIWACGFRDVWPDGRNGERVPVSASAPELFASGCWSCPGSTAL